MKTATTHLIVLLLISGLFIQCSKDDGGATPSTLEPTPVVILQPSAATLSFPVNDEPCLESTAVNDNQSSITFRWNGGDNVSSYELTLTNLALNSEERYTSSGTELIVTLTHSEPYSWKITSIGESGSTPAESATWRFYLAGPAEENYAPFPAELLSPVSGSTVTPIDGVIDLQWICTDVDTDLVSYQLYLDKEDATTLVQTYDHGDSGGSSVEVAVDNNAIYYWKIIAVDAQGNESDSGKYSFRTN